MRAFVFTDAAIVRRAGQFVWLAIDTERTENAPFKRRFPADALPTFFVIDPKTESAALRWVGGGSVPELQKFLDDGRRAVKPASSGVEEILGRADRLYARNENAEAARLYREALAAAPPSWPHYGRAVESLLFALFASKDPEGCARSARDVFGRVEKSPSAANVTAAGLACALELPTENPARPDLLRALREDSLAVVHSPRADTPADDISGLYQELEDDREQAGDEAGKKSLLDAHVAFLEREAAHAKTPEARAVFDSHRLGAYLDLGTPERAVPMLEQSERDFPGDYNPPARLATAYKAMKKWEEAAAASDRALAKAYGPRKIGILQTRSEIETGRGDATASKRYLEEALAIAESLPEGQRSDRTITALKKKLAA